MYPPGQVGLVSEPHGMRSSLPTPVTLGLSKVVLPRTSRICVVYQAWIGCVTFASSSFLASLSA